PWVQTNSKKEAEFVGEQELTFINLGNRSAAVTFLGARIIPVQAVKDPSTCSGAHDFPAYPIGFDTKPFVIKPGEISYIEAKVKLFVKDEGSRRCRKISMNLSKATLCWRA